MEFDLLNPLISSAEPKEPTKPILALFSSESDHMTSSYSSVPYASFRKEAIFTLESVSKADSADPFVPYLAVNYMDRFASELPSSLEGRPWVLPLVAVSCLSLAAKMRDFEFSVSKYQNVVSFDEKTVNRMEALILDALGWRMRSITPFSFLHFFSSMVEPKVSTGPVTDRAKEIVFKAQHEFSLLEFKPSVVAAAASLIACQELFPLEFLPLHGSIFASKLVNMDNVERCINNIQEMICEESTVDSETPSSMSTWNSDSEVNSFTPNSATTASNAENTPMKRRKINFA